MTPKRKKIAVIFGGRSPEHDVSVITGLQVLSAIDTELYDPFPLYISQQGQWLIGDALKQRATYIPGPSALAKLTDVSLEINPGRGPRLIATTRTFLRRHQVVEFDFALPALHGINGEDGQIAALLDHANIPYGGMRALPSALFMDKIATKRALSGAGIPQLPYWKIERPKQGLYIDPEALSPIIAEAKLPCCVKPVHLGSSIGVAKVESNRQLSELLPEIFRYDSAALLEPFVSPLEEYNVSVCRIDGKVYTSAIEKPNNNSELLDFKSKYLTAGGKESEGKLPGNSSAGMLSLTREFNPPISSNLEGNIREWAIRAFEWSYASGIPRFDFLYNPDSNQLWLNEINPCPGSFGFFLWERAEKPLLFSELIDLLISEGLALHNAVRLPPDPTPQEARLFERRS